jgi:hypothetical protein
MPWCSCTWVGQTDVKIGVFLRKGGGLWSLVGVMLRCRPVNVHALPLPDLEAGKTLFYKTTNLRHRTQADMPRSPWMNGWWARSPSN